MAGYSFSQLLDFIQATGEGYLRDQKDFQNDASQNTFFYGKLIDGLGDKMFVNGGQNIRRPIMFKDNGTFAEYRTGQERQWSDVNTMEKLTAYLRFADAHYTIRDQEWLLNDGGGGDNVFHQFFDLKEQKKASAMTAMWNGIEDQLFAEPDVSLMEGDTATAISPYSFFAHVNEYTNGLFQNNGTTWTVKQGLDPTDANITPEYVHQSSTYSAATMGAYGTILEALDESIDDSNFEQPSSFKEYFSNPNMSRCFIVTSTVGRTALKHLNRNGQDTWERWGEGGIKDPTHNGIPVYRAKQMDTATVWDDGSSDNTTEALADIKGPRFLGVNGNFMHPVCHSDRFFYMDGPLRHPNDPEAYVIRYVVWWNLVCTSLRHQFLVSPASDLYY